jgi:hypothetical protein
MRKVFFGMVILLFITGLVLADSFVATVVETEGTPEAVVYEGESIVYYLELLNGKLLSQTDSGAAIADEKARKEAELGKTEEEIAQLVNESKSTVSGAQKTAKNPAAEKVNTRWDNSSTWTSILGGSNSTIIFPPVIADGKSQQLKLVFMPRGSDGIANIDPYINNEITKCYQGWGRFFNNWLGSTIVLGWGEGQETCYATKIENRYFLDVKLSSSGGYSQLVIKSPLIPDACRGKTFSQDTADNQSILKVTC